MLRRLMQFLFPQFKREAPGDMPPKTREEYLRELKNDPYFEEISGEEAFTLIVGAARPASPGKSEQPTGSRKTS